MTIFVTSIYFAGQTDDIWVLTSIYLQGQTNDWVFTSIYFSRQTVGDVETEHPFLSHVR